MQKKRSGTAVASGGKPTEKLSSVLESPSAKQNSWREGECDEERFRREVLVRNYFLSSFVSFVCERSFCPFSRKFVPFFTPPQIDRLVTDCLLSNSEGSHLSDETRFSSFSHLPSATPSSSLLLRRHRNDIGGGGGGGGVKATTEIEATEVNGTVPTRR